MRRRSVDENDPTRPPALDAVNVDQFFELFLFGGFRWRRNAWCGRTGQSRRGACLIGQQAFARGLCG